MPSVVVFASSVRLTSSALVRRSRAFAQRAAVLMSLARRVVLVFLVFLAVSSSRRAAAAGRHTPRAAQAAAGAGARRRDDPEGRRRLTRPSSRGPKKIAIASDQRRVVTTTTTVNVRTYVFLRKVYSSALPLLAWLRRIANYLVRRRFSSQRSFSSRFEPPPVRLTPLALPTPHPRLPLPHDGAEPGRSERSVTD